MTIITFNDYKIKINDLITCGNILTEKDTKDLKKLTKQFLNNCSIIDTIRVVDNDETLFDKILILYQITDNILVNLNDKNLINIFQLFLNYYENHNMITEINRNMMSTMPRLEFIMAQGYFDLIKLFIEYYEKNNLIEYIYNGLDETILHMACASPTHRTYHHIKYIIDYLKLNQLSDCIIQTNAQNQTAFHLACLNRTNDEIQLFISYFIENELYQEFAREDNLNNNSFTNICMNIDYQAILNYLNIIETYEQNICTNSNNHILLSKVHIGNTDRYAIEIIYRNLNIQSHVKEIYKKIIRIIYNSKQKYFLIDEFMKIEKDGYITSKYFIRMLNKVKDLTTIKAVE